MEKFKKRHDLTFKKVFGDSASVDPSVSPDWKNELTNLLAETTKLRTFLMPTRPDFFTRVKWGFCII